MGEARLYFGGVPTDIDVRALREAYPDSGLTVGKTIAYSEVERIVKVGKGSCRFKTVTGRWRRLVEKDSAVLIGVEAGKGFVVLDNKQTLELSCQKLRSGVRATRRSFHVAGYVERKELTADEQRRYDMVAGRAAAIMAAAQLRGKAELPKLGT